ncbi:magnesium/cobalt transporter CorA [Aeromonas schubertii]|uniref:Magnesium transport protein CorA n=1 Tax=Aeromonas schubertii TaxID=652 RepID=A0ABS7V6R3_9GAMM|nr:magnesium/cobalt transporter CorA [Aeromonas schubertii]KUE81379.1 magnesium transporter [Aeromonas schubertii]MBZ6065082.1 magnesium/cobalt transporter CorA [Aeromonas schubertii]MBZ6073549.1 magnesium/cobalt transporter CorA [Aeromonas schubertii]QCG48361.1 magnesium/cobalt transporter CorA [Aeromonas schubertii]
MITAYILNNQVLDIHNLGPQDILPDNTIWLDVYKPDEEEREWLTGLFLEEVPDKEELDDIEASARFYWDTDGLHIHSLFPQRIGRDTKGVHVSFTLRNNLLISIREDDIGLVRLLRHYMRQERLEVENALDVLLEVQNLKVEYLSDLIEDGYKTLEGTADQVFEADQLTPILKELIAQEETNGQIRLSLHDTRRALRFLKRSLRQTMSGEQNKWIDEMLHDVESLLPHTQFLFDKINFQLEAAMGVTNLEQNKVIKIFSVAAVVFLPPTLIASIYGMNFAHMPELAMGYGYPMSIGLMLMSAFGTYFFFKRKGWL